MTCNTQFYSTLYIQITTCTYTPQCAFFRVVSLIMTYPTSKYDAVLDK
jgi:hypothetical protein